MAMHEVVLSLLIPTQKVPGMNINVYLHSLIDDLKILWESGIDTYDAFKKQNFKLHASLLGQLMTFQLMVCCLVGALMLN